MTIPSIAGYPLDHDCRTAMPTVTQPLSTSSAAAVSIRVNGTPRSVPAGHSVADLVGDMKLEGKRIAVERNGEIVARSRYTQVMLADGDLLEIVGAVGGG